MKSAIAAYRELIRHYPRTAAAYNNLGSLYYDSGDYKQAIETEEAGLRLDRNMASSYAILGAAYRALGDNQKAITQFKLALAKNPKDEHSEQELIHAYIDLKQYPDAAERLRARVQRNPKDQQAWRELGDVYLILSQDAHAKVLDIDPESPIALDLVGEIQEGMGNYQTAQAKYEQAVRVAPQMPGTHAHLGNVFWMQGNWAKAEEEFRAELVNAPTDCRTEWKLGNSILNEKSDTSTALQTLSLAIQHCPTLMQARVDRAHALIELGRAPEALNDLLLAERDNPDEPSIHFYLSKAYRAQGRNTEAAAEMQLFGQLADRNKSLGAASSASPGNTPK